MHAHEDLIRSRLRDGGLADRQVVDAVELRAIRVSACACVDPRDDPTLGR